MAFLKGLWNGIERVLSVGNRFPMVGNLANSIAESAMTKATGDKDDEAYFKEAESRLMDKYIGLGKGPEIIKWVGMLENVMYRLPPDQRNELTKTLGNAVSETKTETTETLDDGEGSKVVTKISSVKYANDLGFAALDKMFLLCKDESAIKHYIEAGNMIDTTMKRVKDTSKVVKDGVVRGFVEADDYLNDNLGADGGLGSKKALKKSRKALKKQGKEKERQKEFVNMQAKQHWLTRYWPLWLIVSINLLFVLNTIVSR